MRISSIALALLAVSGSVTSFAPNNVLLLPQRRFLSHLSMSENGSTLTRLPESAVELTLKIPGSATKAAYDKTCTELSKDLSIPGFRKGAKISPKVLEQNMAAKGGRNALKAQAINSLLENLIEPALKEEHGLDPIGQPALTIPADVLADDFVPGEPIDLVVKCDVWPDISWATVEGQEKPYIGLTGKYKRGPYDEAKFNKALTDLRERYAVLEPAGEDRELEMGDACRVNMVGYMAKEDGTKGDPLPNTASGDNVEVILGPGRYMEGLVEGLLGAKVGDERTVKVSFPVNLRDKTLAGKGAIFDVSIFEASIRSLPEVDDEFANKVRAGLSAQGLKDELQAAVDVEDAKQYAPARNAALGKSLSEIMDVEVPDTLVTNQAKEKFAMMMTDMRNNGVADEEIKEQISPENFGKYKDIAKDDIVRDFKVSMATDEIARLEGIEVPDSEIEEQVLNVKKDIKEGEEIDEKMLRGKIETTLMRGKVFDFLSENANLEVDFNEEEFDVNIMKKLAEDSLKREEEWAGGPDSAESRAESSSTALKGKSGNEDEEVTSGTMNFSKGEGGTSKRKNKAANAEKAKEEAEADAKAAVEAKAKAAVEAKAKAEAEAKAKAEAEAKAKAEAEAKAKAEAEAKAKAEAEAKAQAEAEAKAKAEAEALEIKRAEHSRQRALFAYRLDKDKNIYDKRAAFAAKLKARQEQVVDARSADPESRAKFKAIVESEESDADKCYKTLTLLGLLDSEDDWPEEEDPDYDILHGHLCESSNWIGENSDGEKSDFFWEVDYTKYLDY